MKIELSGNPDKEQVLAILAEKLHDSSVLTDIFYVLSSLNQLHRLGFIEEYTSVPEYSETLFFFLRDAGYPISDEEVEMVLDLSEQWDDVTKQKLFKFYKAYHAIEWDMQGRIKKKER